MNSLVLCIAASCLACPQTDKTPAYSPTRLIVKFRGPGDHCVEECACRIAGIKKDDAVPDALQKYSSLISLNRKYQLVRVRSLFLRPKGITTTAAREQQARRLLEIRERFPKRSKRSVENKRPDLSNYYVLEFPKGCHIREVCKKYRENPYVDSVSLDYSVQLKGDPNDPFFSSRGSWGQKFDDLWGLKKMNMEEAWETSKGKGIVVAVVDSGVDHKHPDIADNIWSNAEEIPDNGKDDDGNGFVDDVIGWDFANDDNDPMDTSGVGHGTHVAGTIAAVGNNGVGIIGVAPESRIMAVKGIRKSSAEFSTLAPALYYAIANGADVVNCSWGPGTTQQSPFVIEDLIRTGYSLGVVFVFAAGNDDHHVDLQSPPSMRETITVGSWLTNNKRAPSSNWGTTLDVCAPGGAPKVAPPDARPDRAILSLRASYISGSTSASVGDGYLRLSGTSMAAPHVSGLAALVLAHRQSFTIEDVRQAIRTSAVDVAQPGFDINTGFGFVDAARALKIADPVRVQIDEPADGTNVGNQRYVRIRGEVSSESLDRWSISYAPLADLGRAETIAKGQAGIENGPLGVLDADAMPYGAYLVRLVAVGESGHQFEKAIRVYKERPKINQLSSTSVNTRGPVVCSDKYAVWSISSGEDDDEVQSLILHNLRTSRSETIVSGVKLIDEEIVDADIDNRTVIWATAGDGSDEAVPAKIGVYDIKLKQTTELDVDLTDLVQVEATKTHIAYEDDGRVKLYNRKTKGVSQIGDHIGGSISMSGDFVAWGNGSQIELFDIAYSKHQVLAEDLTFTDTSPAIDGTCLVWRRDTDKNGRTDAIMLYDMKTEELSTIARDLRHAGAPAVNGNWVSWTSGENSNDDIYLHHLPTGQRRQITAALSSQVLPVMSKRNLIWLDYSGRSRSGEVERFEAFVQHMKIPRHPDTSRRNTR